MNFYIAILSKKNDIDRRDSIRFQLNNLNFNSYHFFNAYTPDKDNEFIIKNKLNDELTQGECCCSLGHIFILKQFLKSEKDFIIVAEDDAIFSDDFFNRIKAINEKLKLCDILILGYSKVETKLKNAIQYFRPGIIIKKDNNFSTMLPYRQWKCGTVCYAINREGAKKIIQLNYPVKCTADDWDYFEKHGVDILHITPLLVLEDNINHTSNIESERKTFVQRPILLRYIAGSIRHFLILFRLKKYIKLKFKDYL